MGDGNLGLLGENVGALEDCREQVAANYRQKTGRSKALFDRARDVLPGGASGNLRYFAPYPLYMKTGDGCRFTDADGHRYIDCFSCNGPLLLGHRHPAVMAAISEVQDVGTLVVNPEIMISCAEKLQQVIPCAERVRFLNSGTEAVMTALRYARAYTGKEKVVKFFGHYHGQDDQVLLGMTPDRQTFGAGVPTASIENTLTLPFNDTTLFETLINERDDIAAVVLDPAMHAGGLWGASREFLETIRSLTKANNIVLIFDEVITGFRMGVGGAQTYHGVTPDLATFAKALSAGEKLAAVVGSANVMSVTDPLAPEGTPQVFQSGTGNDGTLALAAGLAAINEYERLERAGAYGELWGRVEVLETGIRRAFQAAGIGIHVNRLASMMQLFVTQRKPSYEDYATLNNDLLDLFFLALINEGVLLSLPTSNHIYFSFAHDQAAFDEIEATIGTVLQRYPFSQAYTEQIQRSAG